MPIFSTREMFENERIRPEPWDKAGHWATLGQIENNRKSNILYANFYYGLFLIPTIVMNFAENRITLFDSLLGSGLLSLIAVKRFSLQLMSVLKSVRNPEDASHEPEFYVPNNLQRQIESGLKTLLFECLVFFSDCGVFTCLFADLIFHSHLKEVESFRVTANDILRLREVHLLTYTQQYYG